MLVPFVIDADSLAPDPAWTPATRRACHRSLLDVWQRLGLLTHDGATFDTSKLKEAVLKLPPELRPLWLEVLERLPRTSCGASWDGSVSQANISMVAALSRLAVVDDTHAEADFGFGEDDDEKSLNPDGRIIDVCRMQAASQAQVFRDATARAGAHIEVGDTFQAIWETRFQALAAAPIKNVCIVDRYAAGKHREPNAKCGLSGLERFMRMLDQSATGPRYLTLISTWADQLQGKSIDDVKRAIEPALTRLPHRRIRLVTVKMVPNTAFRDDAHDRFVRFGDHYVWDIGLGLEVLEAACAAKRSAATFKSGSLVANYKQIELDLVGSQHTKTLELRC